MVVFKVCRVLCSMNGGFWGFFLRVFIERGRKVSFVFGSVI